MIADLRVTPALTLLNPWADLIAHHGKNIENRTWAPPASVTSLLIHAGKGWDNQWTGSVQAIGDLGHVQPSAIIALVDVVRVCDLSRAADHLRCACNRWAMPGHHHWHLGHVRALPEPVPCRGRQGLWYPAPAIIAAVAAQLGRITP